MQKITPFLFYDGLAQEAMDLYTSIFKNSKVTNTRYQGESLLWGTFELEGQEFMVLNGGSMYKFSGAISFFVKCETQAEVDEYWAKLTANGGEELQCGWLKDKFGVAWQIIPNALTRMMHDKDPVKADRVMQAMMKMVKIDIQTLQDAYDGK